MFVVLVLARIGLIFKEAGRGHSQDSRTEPASGIFDAIVTSCQINTKRKGACWGRSAHSLSGGQQGGRFQVVSCWAILYSHSILFH